ncbi:MAG: hypothetical protein DWB48_01725 [Nitrosomonas sp.]|nr:hypothetical protein [Nitrosomonas sp.]MCE7916679.1 hypothetical protein [Nitrosomonas sp. PRO5]MDL1863614.1 hypothetical protein [Betaproteobacteria bacterium PRO5]
MSGLGNQVFHWKILYYLPDCKDALLQELDKDGAESLVCFYVDENGHLLELEQTPNLDKLNQLN